MSAAIANNYVSTILPKSLAKLKEEKPPLLRSASIDTIKRINTFICSPESYILPAILTTWLKTGQQGLHASTEKTIFMFRSLFFSTYIYKHLLNYTKTQNIQLLIQTIYNHLAAVFLHSLVITLSFIFTVIVLTVQLCLCTFYLMKSEVSLGLVFLIVSSSSIVLIGHRINRCYLVKNATQKTL